MTAHPAGQPQFSMASSAARVSRVLGMLVVAMFVGVAGGSCSGNAADDPGLQSNAGIDWRDEVIYQLITDRFADGDPNNNFHVMVGAPNRYHGGDWQGIIDNLWYLKELGVTCIWISPHVKNVEQDVGNYSYHGYWTQSFIDTNPHFGDLAKLREMVKACHAAGIKVVADVVVNHIGQLFYYDINLNGVPDDSLFGYNPPTRVSEYDPPFDSRGIQAKVGNFEMGAAPIKFFNWPADNRVPPNPPEFANPDWYYKRGGVTDFNQQIQTETGDFPGGLKDLDTSRQDVRDKLVEVFAYWIAEVDFDGFRIDTVKHVEETFWPVFCAAMRQAAAARGKQNFFMFGEAFDGNDALLARYTKTNMLDSVFYFSQKYAVIDSVLGNNSATINIENLMNQRFSGNPSSYLTVPQPDGIGVSPANALVNFIDNHDVPRFLSQFDTNKLNLALGYIFTMPGIPCVYYGTEQGFDGAADPANRETLWLSSFDTTNAHFARVKKWTALRAAHAPLRTGSFQIRWSTTRTGAESDAGIFAFERVDGGQRVLVVMNCHPSKTSNTTFGGSDMTVGFSNGTLLRDQLDSNFTITVSGGTLNVSVPPLGVRVLAP